ncbi:di-trans,poly-cis-decaprenylcistransferase, partial [Candidatus Woesearchaeota archaeon]|nr:di-trans,poly-cis-decaprenylcistransferase [Candidatus Woesearchaeota archaeon]
DIFENRIRINVIGRLEMFPKGIRKAMLDIMEKTKNHRNFTVNFAMAYGGRQEIVDAFRKIIKSKIKPNQINEKLIANNLYLKSEPDLVIRPGGEIRTSNFLTWQSVYSEWIFIDKLWPEFTKQDLIKCIEEFNKRERRFGE